MNNICIFIGQEISFVYKKNSDDITMYNLLSKLDLNKLRKEFTKNKNINKKDLIYKYVIPFLNMKSSKFIKEVQYK